MEMRSSLFFSLRVWGTQTSRLLTFPIFFKWREIVDWNVSRQRGNFRWYLRWLYFTSSLKVPWLMSDERPCLDSCFNDVSPEQYFENFFRTRRSVITLLPLTLELVSAVSVAFLLFLNPDKITCWICTFSFSFFFFFFWVWNYDAYLFTTERRMADEGTL